MSALGRGLGSLIPGGGADADAPDEPQQVLPVSQIRPNPNQPRKIFESSHLEELKESIKNHGILQPICVRPIEGGFEIVSGERRWRAARLAGLTQMPVVVREVDDEQMLELALVENVQRQDLDPIEKARGFQEMIERLGVTQEAVAQKVGLKRATVANHLRLLDLPDEAQEAVVNGLITMGHARALAGLPKPAQILKALGSIVRDDLSVRQTEQLVRDGAQTSPSAGASKATPAEAASSQPAWIGESEGRLREALGCQVQIQNKRGFKGQIVLRYSGRDEIDRLLDQLAPKEEL